MRWIGFSLLRGMKSNWWKTIEKLLSTFGFECPSRQLVHLALEGECQWHERSLARKCDGEGVRDRLH